MGRAEIPGAVHLAGTRLLGFVTAAVPGEAGVELREQGQTIAVIRHFADHGSLLLGRNQLFNSDFQEGAANWRMSLEGGSDECIFGVDLSEEWHPAQLHVGYVRQKGADAHSVATVYYHDPVEGPSLPVTEGCTYELWGRFATHRCIATITFEWLAEGGVLLDTATAKVPDGVEGGTDPNQYVTRTLIACAPPGARAVRISLKKHGTLRKEGSFLFFHSLLFAAIDPNVPVDEWASPPWANDTLAMVRSLQKRATHAFDAPLPADVLDRRSHELEALSEQTGEPLEGSPLVVHYRGRCSGAIEGLQGAVVVGWAVNEAVPDKGVELVLSVDGVDAVRGIADKRHARGRCGFRLPLPAQVLTGRPISIEVREARTHDRIGLIACLAPSVLTPWDVLQRNSRAEHASHLAPMAAYRYRALAAHLSRAEKQGLSADSLAQLHHAHAALVRGPAVSTKVYRPLTLDRPDAPDVSVVIPAHNAFPVTYNCLAALILAYNEASFEVIVVDDGSDDQTASIEELARGITVVRHERAQGFLRACQAGVAKARGKYVVLLNNDTEPLVHWLDELLFVFENFEGIGLVGSQLLYPDGTLQDAGGIVWDNGDPANYGRRQNAHDSRFNYTRQVDYVTGASLMISKALWDEVGGFDEEFCPAYFEDTDLAFKVRAAGKKVVYAPLSRVVHYEGMSHGTDVSAGGKKQQELNRPKFKRKWSAALQHNGRVGRDSADLVKDRGIRYRVLFIDHQFPRPDNDAGGYAAIQEIRLVQALGCKVTFMPDNLAYLGEYTAELQRMGVETIYGPLWQSAEAFLAARGAEFDAIYITRYKVAEKHLERIRRNAPQAKVLLCNADLHFLRELREALRLRDDKAIEAAAATRERELKVMQEVDLTLSYNPTEHAVIVSHNLQATKVATCPWVVDVVDDAPGFDARSGIAYLGGFAHPPNEGAVLFFIEQVMPLLRARLPGAPFLIYGSQVPKSIEALAADDVLVKGYVEDVAEVYDTCKVFVAPLLSGAGLKGKVAGALAHGTPSVLSPTAAEGIAIRSGREAYVAATPEEWAAAIGKLYASREAWEAMSRSAREFAAAEWSYERGKELMREAFEQADVYAHDANASALAQRDCWPSWQRRRTLRPKADSREAHAGPVTGLRTRAT